MSSTKVVQIEKLGANIKKYQLVGPDWLLDSFDPLGDGLFDIDDKLPAGATRDKVPLMLQALLAERFKLAIRRRNRESDTSISPTTLA